MMHRWFALPHTLRFLAAGGFNTCLGYGLVFLGQYLLGGRLWPQAIFILAYILSSFVSFTVMKHLVFRTRGSYIREYLRYMLSSAASALAGTVVLSLYVYFAGDSEYVAQAVAMTASVVTSYFSLQYFAFRKSNQTDTQTPSNRE